MAKVRVQLPLGALQSLKRIVFDGDLHHEHDSSRTRRQDVGKPDIPRVSGARDRRFKSGHPDSYCGGTRVGTGRRLLTAQTLVRFQPPQLVIRKVKPIGDGSPFEAGRAMSLAGSTPSPSALRAPLAERQRLQPSKLARWVRLPQGALRNMIGDRLSGRLPGFEPGDGGSNPSPRAFFRRAVSRRKHFAESSSGRMRRSERLHAGSIPASAALDRWKPTGWIRTLS